jgi:3-hydroxyacyl-CoA dehydrogenase
VKSELLAALPGQKLFAKIVDRRPGGRRGGLRRRSGRPARARHPLPRVRDLPLTHPNADAYFQFARNMVKAMAPHFPAPAKCVDAVEQAVVKRASFDAGMVYEREAFMALMMTPECKALRHAFFAERAASKIPDVPEDTPVRAIAKVAVIGAGTMGGGISMNFLNAGIPVTILEMKPEALDRGVATIRKNYEAQVKKGKLKADKLEQRMALLGTTLSYDDVQGRRPRDRGRVRGDGRQGTGLQARSTR